MLHDDSILCPQCKANDLGKFSQAPKTGEQKYRCKSCLYQFVPGRVHKWKEPSDRIHSLLASHDTITRWHHQTAFIFSAKTLDIVKILAKKGRKPRLYASKTERKMYGKNIGSDSVTAESSTSTSQSDAQPNPPETLINQLKHSEPIFFIPYAK